MDVGETTKRAQRWSSKSPDGIYLQELISAGELEKMNAKGLKMEYPLFKDYLNTSLNAAMRSFRKTTGDVTEEDMKSKYASFDISVILHIP